MPLDTAKKFLDLKTCLENDIKNLKEENSALNHKQYKKLLILLQSSIQQNETTISAMQNELEQFDLANHHRILKDEQSAIGLKKKSCSRKFFEDEAVKNRERKRKVDLEPIKSDLKFVIKRNSDGSIIKKIEENKDVQKKEENVIEKNKDEFEPKSETKNQKKKKEKFESRDLSNDECENSPFCSMPRLEIYDSSEPISPTRTENSPFRSMPRLDIYDPSEPILPTSRHMPKIIEIRKLDQPDFLDLNNLAPPIPTPSQCQNNPDFDAEALFGMVSNEVALDNEAELLGESLLPLDPAMILNLEVDDIVEMMSEIEKDDIVEPNENNVNPFSLNVMNRTDDGDDEPPVLKKRKITSSKGSLGSVDKKMKLDWVLDGPQFGDPKYLTSDNGRVIKASKILNLSGDFGKLWIHETATEVVDENKSNYDATLQKLKNGLTNSGNDTDMDYSSYSSSSDEEIEKKIEKEKKDKGKKTGDEVIEDDYDELEEDKRCEDAKNSEQEDEKEKEKEDEDAKNDKPYEKNLDDCLSIMYSDDEDLFKSPEREISSKNQLPETKPDFVLARPC